MSTANSNDNGNKGTNMPYQFRSLELLGQIAASVSGMSGVATGTRTTTYQAIAAGAGYSIGDILVRYDIIDITTSTVLATIWYNQNLQTVIVVPAPGNLVPIAPPSAVTVINAPGAAAVNIQDGGNSITVDSANLDVAISTRNAEATQLLIHALLTTIDGDTSNLDVALSTRASEVTLLTRATEATSLLIKGDTANLDIALSTRASEATLALVATEATLATMLTLAGFQARINTLGQKTSANSTPVVLASDQSAIPVTGPLTDVQLRATPVNITSTDQGRLSTSNNSTTPLVTLASFIGVGELVTSYPTIIASVFTDQAGTLFMEFSPDNVNWDSSISFSVAANGSESHRFIVLKPYYRTRFVNTSAVNQTFFRLTTIFGAQALINLPSNATMQLDSDSISVRPTDANLEIARGLRMGQSIINVNGRNADIDIGTETVWNFGGLWTPQVIARTLSCVSSNAADTAAGTGARTIMITGVNALRELTTETVIMNGGVPVITVNTWLGVNLVRVLTAGSGNVNAGNITLTSTTDGFVQGYILATQSVSFQSIYHVPVGYNAFLKRIVLSVNKVSGGGGQPIVNINGYVVMSNGVKLTATQDTLEPLVKDSTENNSTNYIAQPGGSYFWHEATTDQNNTNVYARIEGILVQV